MKRNPFFAGILASLAIGLPVFALAQSPTPVQTDSKEAIPAPATTIATDKIKDMTARLVVKETNKEELKKMGGAFGASIQYSIRRMNVAYQYPNKARFDGKFLRQSIMLVYNGNSKMYKVPLKKETKNIEGQPGQKQTLMDLGLFARDYLTTDYLPTFLRNEKGLQVYKLSQRNTENKSHEIVWVNPKTAIIERRLSYNGDNVLKKELRFVQPVQVQPGIWIPTRVELLNQDGKIAVVQGIEDIKVNLGVDATLFETI